MTASKERVGLVLNRPTNKSLTDFLPDHELDALG
jgi:hypothetical protein